MQQHQNTNPTEVIPGNRLARVMTKPVN